MKIRTLYFKVNDVAKAAAFWSELLQVKPHKDFEKWKEISCNNIRLGFLLNDFGDKFQGSGCIPVFEFPDAELPDYIGRAKTLGAEVIIDNLDDPNMKSIAFRDPFGHEFELSKFHD
jgi:catechol 2,3-dioxygenase-like lactoylglutathione lyase family enzyme